MPRVATLGVELERHSLADSALETRCGLSRGVTSLRRLRRLQIEYLGEKNAWGREPRAWRRVDCRGRCLECSVSVRWRAIGIVVALREGSVRGFVHSSVRVEFRVQSFTRILSSACPSVSAKFDNREELRQEF